MSARARHSKSEIISRVRIQNEWAKKRCQFRVADGATEVCMFFLLLFSLFESSHELDVPFSPFSVIVDFVVVACLRRPLSFSTHESYADRWPALLYKKTTRKIN